MIKITEPVVTIDLDLEDKRPKHINKPTKVISRSSSYLVRYESLYHYLYYANHPSKLECNKTYEDCCILDNTYIDNLLSPTDDELAYLEIIVGDLVVERYKELLEVINV